MEQNVFTHNAETKERDKAFVDELVESVYENFRKQALSRLNYDEDLADEAIADMYSTAVKKAHTVATHPHPEAWLAKVLQICIKRQISKRANHPESRFTFVNIDEVADFLPDPRSFSDELTVDDSDIADAKDKILASLSETELVTYKLRCEEKLSVNEIAKRLNVSPETIRTRLYRLKVKVKAMADNILF